jgi:lysophospholipase L1-like esterase
VAAPAPPRTRRAGLPARLAVAGGSLLFAVLAVELYLRAVGYHPLEDARLGKGVLARRSAWPDLGYELVPDGRGIGWGTEVALNSAGFRDREYARAKGGRYRIVALGDSITFGNRLGAEDTWPEVLERRLGEQGAPLDVLNLGVPGYDTCQEVAFLEHAGLAYEPDVVVLAFCANDLGIVSVTKAHAFSAQDGERLIYRSRIAQWLRTVEAERERKRKLVLDNLEQRYERAYADQILPLDEHPSIVQRMSDLRRALEQAGSATRRIPRWFAMPARVGRLKFAFERLHRLSRGHGFEVVVLLVPFLDEDPFLAQGYEIVELLCQSYDFDVVRADEAFRERGLERLRVVPGDPIHPGKEGHALLAAALEEFLRGSAAGRAAAD